MEENEIESKSTAFPGLLLVLSRLWGNINRIRPFDSLPIRVAKRAVNRIFLSVPKPGNRLRAWLPARETALKPRYLP